MKDVPQQAWIINETAQDNILFGSDFEPNKYANVVKICNLQKDFDIMKNGDLTYLGEKGGKTLIIFNSFQFKPKNFS